MVNFNSNKFDLFVKLLIRIRCKLHWTEGHNWKGYLPVKCLDDEFEYKFVIQNSKTNEVIKWEAGDNRRMSFINIRKYLDTPDIAKIVWRSKEYCFSYGNSKMIYFPGEMKLAIVEYWKDC